jgi:hypothetical protein
MAPIHGSVSLGLFLSLSEKEKSHTYTEKVFLCDRNEGLCLEASQTFHYNLKIFILVMTILFISISVTNNTVFMLLYSNCFISTPFDLECFLETNKSFESPKSNSLTLHSCFYNGMRLYILEKDC